ncbi:MAG: FAD-dependent monooxygenase [Geodermatophilaceae bacterium]|nr:FAD-dependent monooxygenase [Geodermatophilaceae bacterium]
MRRPSWLRPTARHDQGRDRSGRSRPEHAGRTSAASFRSECGRRRFREEVALIHPNDVRILVVGAGIAGLAAARALRGWGAAVEIVERAAGPTSEGAGVYLPGNAVRALHALGLGTQVVDSAGPDCGAAHG